MNPAEILITIAIVAVLGLIVRGMYRSRKAGKSAGGCSGNCAGCASKGGC